MKLTRRGWIAGLVVVALVVGVIAFFVHVENQRRSCWMKSGSLVWVDQCVRTGDYNWKTHQWDRWVETP